MIRDESPRKMLKRWRFANSCFSDVHCGWCRRFYLASTRSSFTGVQRVRCNRNDGVCTCISMFIPGCVLVMVSGELAVSRRLLVNVACFMKEMGRCRQTSLRLKRRHGAGYPRRYPCRLWEVKMGGVSPCRAQGKVHPLRSGVKDHPCARDVRPPRVPSGSTVDLPTQEERRRRREDHGGKSA